MQQLIYLIRGDQGEYSDRRQWIVKAYETKDAAYTEAQRMRQEMRRLEEKYKDDPCDLHGEEAEKEIEALDPKCGSWYFPARYDVIEVPLCK